MDLAQRLTTPDVEVVYGSSHQQSTQRNAEKIEESFRDDAWSTWIISMHVDPMYAE